MILSQEKIQEIKNRYEIIGNSPLLNHAIEKAIKVAPTDISVLVSGESGVGKEAFSKIIHNLGKRKHGNFIAINCAAIPEGTIDSELFGHEKGAFTSAYEARKGYFETVNGGTIFLDEISELPRETQSRLLRVLETGEYIKVGSSKVLKTDIRLVAASNKDLLELTQNGKFREDLYYRLSTINIKIPSLRKRKEDIPLLFAKFANDFADKYKTPPLELDTNVMEMLKDQYWPGNIRQLKNLIEQISILETDRLITAQKLLNFLPETQTKELVPISDSIESDSPIQEREILYKFLFDIKQDVGELKTLIYDMLNNSEATGQRLGSSEVFSHRFLKSGKQPVETQVEFVKQTSDTKDATNDYYSESTDIAEVNSLSLQDKEKEMIKEALIKHKSRRKPAANELGISERTLYRKIKEYDLEDL